MFKETYKETYYIDTQQQEIDILQIEKKFNNHQKERFQNPSLE